MGHMFAYIQQPFPHRFTIYMDWMPLLSAVQLFVLLIVSTSQYRDCLMWLWGIR